MHAHIVHLARRHRRQLRRFRKYRLVLIGIEGDGMIFCVHVCVDHCACMFALCVHASNPACMHVC